ncbi:MULTISPECIES: M48 family metallopeptidase [unclassified Streptomyces]|uniref:M48 family metallopeptidase n=1 Tax=unclassified Streptomyces TaxID=2593676 RepID=UPI002E0F8856|nr:MULTISPECIES: M48 family metallopeptidase [unclassified Streptomyces]WSR29061.1 M48 family metallopeptidase [Streptomyces sp. NBC_01205]
MESRSTEEVTSVRECPECGAPVPVDARHVDWCAACDWNVDPGAPDPEPGRIPAARRRLAHAYGEQLAAEMEQGGGRSEPVGRDAATLSALALSLVVHGVTVVLAVTGILLVVLGWDTGVQPVLGALLLGLAAVLRPRPERLPKDAPVLYRADAPKLFELIDEVGAAVGTAGVHAVVVTTESNAAVTTYGWRARRMMLLGLGLWEILPPQERVALLGHELGHFAHGDTRRGIVTGGALRALATWSYVLAPTPPRGLLDRFVNAVTFLPRWAVCGLVVLLDHLTLRASQRAEYLADVSAAKAGSTEAAVGLMDRLLISPAVGPELRRESVAAHVRGGSAGREAREQAERGLWERLALRMAAVPEHEYERLRRVAARRGHSVDSTHPPTHLRRRCAATGGPYAAQVTYTEACAAAVAQELAPARTALAGRVIRDYAG